MVSHYRIVEKIGAGGMGEVYLAEDTKLSRKVALKFLTGQYSNDADSKARFANEARAAAALDHPNICPVYEFNEYEGRTYIVMAYIDGKTLHDRVKSGPLDIESSIRFGTDIAEGLAEAHEKGIIHRDIKSADVIINSKERAKITDIGLARILDQCRLTKAAVVMGTVAYMSPEQIQAGPVDHRSDIWSLGVVLYEMVTGQLPFRGEQERAVTQQIQCADVYCPPAVE